MDSLVGDAVGADNVVICQQTAEDKKTTDSSDQLPGVGIHSRPDESDVDPGLSGFSDLFIFHRG